MAKKSIPIGSLVNSAREKAQATAESLRGTAIDKAVSLGSSLEPALGQFKDSVRHSPAAFLERCIPTGIGRTGGGGSNGKSPAHCNSTESPTNSSKPT